MNKTPEFHSLEFMGLLVWVASWILENLADTQKMLFVADCKEMAKYAEAAEKKRLKFSVLGYTKPFDSSRYWLWTMCRHPNYFFEWMVWCGFAAVGFGSVATKDDWLEGGQGTNMTILLSVTLILMLRFFYDCLLYWTGAAPSEQQSVRKRPDYKFYQKCTRVFFPFPVPNFIVDHHMVQGWLLNEGVDGDLTHEYSSKKKY